MQASISTSASHLIVTACLVFVTVLTVALQPLQQTHSSIQPCTWLSRCQTDRVNVQMHMRILGIERNRVDCFPILDAVCPVKVCTLSLRARGTYASP